MKLLTVTMYPQGAQAPMYDYRVKTASMLLDDGRTTYVEIRDVAAAFEIEEPK